MNNTDYYVGSFCKNSICLVPLFGVFMLSLFATVVLANVPLEIGPFLKPGGIFIFPLSFVIADIVSENYGYKTAKKFIITAVSMEVLFVFIVSGMLRLPNPEFWLYAEAYKTVFDPAIRYVLSSLVALFIGELVNAYLLDKWRIQFKGKWFILRSLGSTAIGQAILTVIVDILAFYGRYTNEQLVNLMFSGYMVKMLYAILFVFPTWYFVRKISQIERKTALI